MSMSSSPATATVLPGPSRDAGGWESATLHDNAYLEDIIEPQAIMDHAEEQQIDSDAERALKPASDAIPEGGYGWVCVVCAALINGHSWGINSVSLS